MPRLFHIAPDKRLKAMDIHDNSTGRRPRKILGRVNASIWFPFSRRTFFVIFSYIALASLILSCAAGSSALYDSDYPLTKEIARAKSSPLKINIPQGWVAAEDNENNLIDLWLIREDYSATLNFIPVNLDSAAAKEIGEDEINGLLKLSKSFRKISSKSALKFMNQEIFELNGKKIGAYEYLNNSGTVIRVAVFKTGKKYYELSAVPKKPGDQKELYSVQNSVLSSIE
ncbi:MAG: hypothetical protein WC061_01960 [Melioribacteraceae bacterium]